MVLTARPTLVDRSQPKPASPTIGQRCTASGPLTGQLGFTWSHHESTGPPRCSCGASTRLTATPTRGCACGSPVERSRAESERTVAVDCAAMNLAFAVPGDQLINLGL